MRLHQFIRINDFPEHFHQMDALVIGKTVLDRARKPEKLDRILYLAFRRLDKLMGFIMREFETMFTEPLDPPALGRAELGIRGCGIHKQHRRREVKFIRCVATGIAAASGLFDLEKGLKSIKHNASYHTSAGSANHSVIPSPTVHQRTGSAMVT